MSPTRSDRNQQDNAETDSSVLQLGNGNGTSSSTTASANNRSIHNQYRSPNLRPANKVLFAQSPRHPQHHRSSSSAPAKRWSSWAWALLLWIVWDCVLMQQLDHHHRSTDHPDVLHVRRRAAYAARAKTTSGWSSTSTSTTQTLPTPTQQQEQQQHQQHQQHEVTATAVDSNSRKEKAMLQKLEEENKTRQLEEAAARLVDFLEHPHQHTTAVVPATTTERPPLESILDPNNDHIIGDPGFLLDVAVIGFGKCGTSTMMDWIGTHPQVRVFPQEVWDLTDNKLPQFIRRLYTELEPGPYLHGYKAPQDITQDRILDLYRTYWPHAKLIVGIRHPIPWFESFYNFRIQTVPLKTLNDFPAPEHFIGRPLCSRDVRGSRRTCTSKGDFAYELLRLGKHNYPQPRLPSELEQSIVQRYAQDRVMNFTAMAYMENPVLLFETEQLAATNEGRVQFRQDVSDFLGVSPILGEIPHTKPGSAQEYSPTEQALRNERKLQICDAAHAELRAALMHLARDTSRWLRESGVLNVPTVFVPQRTQFEERLLLWMEDPCVSVSKMEAIE